VGGADESVHSDQISTYFMPRCVWVFIFESV